MTQEDAPELCVRCNCAGPNGFILVKELSGATDFYYDPQPCREHWNKMVQDSGATGPIVGKSIYERQ